MSRRGGILIGLLLLFAGTARAANDPPSDPGRSTHVRVAPAESLAVFPPATWRPASTAPAADMPHIVLLPGVLGSAFSMRHLTAAFAQAGVMALVIDPLGMGASSRPADADYSLDAQARRVLAVLDSLGWPRSVFVGQGTSATIALRAAARAPAHVQAVVSIAGGPVATQGTDGVRTALRFGRLLNTPPGRAVARRQFARELRARAVDPGWITPAVERAYVAPLLADVPRALRVLRAMHAASEPDPLETMLARVRVPVRVFVGRAARPGAPAPSQLALLQQYTRDVQIDSLAGGGVLLHEELPDVLAPRITALARTMAAGQTTAAAPDRPPPR